MNKNEAGSAPTISLPQGGGALQGIGETFAPDLHTGTGNFTVPIGLPPGRHGLQPQLSLVYSTGNGNGDFGMGWSLSIPGVSRKTSQGIPRYEAESDVFLLSGAEDLIPVTSVNGVTKFRPRTEGLFARIEHHQNSETDHWQVSSKDGLTSFYGTPNRLLTDPAIIADPADRRRLFNWKLSQTQDTFGNQVKYEYERDFGDEGEHIWDGLYLKRISYADLGASQPEDFLISVNFSYEDRPDPFSSYRAGFEQRTQKRCTRIEVKSHAGIDRLVRVYQFIYLDQRGLPPERLPLNSVSVLSQVLVEGHNDRSVETLPPLEFEYTAFDPISQRFQACSAQSNAMPGKSLADPEFALVDLFGNGLPDVVQVNGQVRYWRNQGGGQFDFPRTMEAAPALFHLQDAGVQLLDANGDGRTDLVISDGLRNGYYPLTFDGSWHQSGFVPYQQAPTIDLDAPDVRLLDLTGDGVTDALRTGVNFELFYNDPLRGWVEVETRQRRVAEDFPNVSFADPRVKLGDLTGDGLQAIIKIDNGRVEYWPYLGYGRWGRRVSMQNSPRFEDTAFFPGIGYDPKRLLVGDIDGDGLDDLIYVSSGQITLWINQCGNRWSDPITIHGTPPVVDSTAVRLADMLGNGTDGILWTYDFDTFRDSTYKFLDFTGGVKPYVLSQMDNHLGAVTKVAYAPSTRFYLADRERPETRWQAPLPFPVQVVVRVEAIDLISHSKLTTEYRYHQGYWDGVEREFRGFGYVEQLDTEIFIDYHTTGLHGDTQPFASVETKYFSPPTLTKTWFHQGPVGEENGDWYQPNRSAAYWAPDRQELSHTAVINAVLDKLPNPRAKRDAIRTLRGSILRTELYALDNSRLASRPYTITEYVYGVREESPPTELDRQRSRIFFPHQIAQRTSQWERGSEQMTQISYTDDYDLYGQPQSQINIAVPRGRDFRRPVATAEPYLVTQSITTFANRDDTGHYLIGRPTSVATYEISNDGRKYYFQLFREIRANLLPRQLIAQSFNYYDGEAFIGLPLGQLGNRGVSVRSEALVMSEENLRAADPQIPPYLQPNTPPQWTNEYPAAFRLSVPTLAGYTFADGSDRRPRGYYVQATRLRYDFQNPLVSQPRGLVEASRDPLGNDTQLQYDRFQLLPVQVTDAAGLTQTAEYDYRVFQPKSVIDPNGNQMQFTFSPLGLPLEIFAIGEGTNEGDRQRPSTRFVYDFQAFERRQQPVAVRAIRHQHHDSASDIALPERDATIETIEYSDGFGRVIQTRTQAEDLIFAEDLLPADRGARTQPITGTVRTSAAPPNVVVSGWQIFDNKGRVVEKFEPFFANGWDYDPPSTAERGQKVQMFYDPRGQVIRTVNPDGSQQQVIYGIPTAIDRPDTFTPTPWEAYTYDANDLAPLSRSPEGLPLNTAAPVSHHFTPANIVIDPLGRTVLAIARNRPAADLPIEEIQTRSTYDIRGNLLSVTDALNRVAFAYSYDLANRPLRTDSIDAGQRRIVLNAMGQEIERRDSKGALILQAYDKLHRPTHLWAGDDAAATVTLRQAIEYGDAGDPNQAVALRQSQRQANRLGKPHRHYDESGRTTLDTYDFKGNPIDKTRQVISDAELLTVFANPTATGYAIDWQLLANQTLEDRANSLLDARKYQTTLSYDGLNRLLTLRYPLDLAGERKTLRPHYNNAGALERVTLDDRTYVAQITYNAKGQRTLIARGNGIITRYAYDPHTFRLLRMCSENYTSANPTTFQPTGGLLQDFSYSYDLAGNIQTLIDRVLGSGVLNSPEGKDALTRLFEYDAIYRLTAATGRESNTRSISKPWLDDPRRTGFNSPNAGNPTQDNAPNLTVNYTENYSYDLAGNIQSLRHSSGTNVSVRQFSLVDGNNRLSQLTIGPDKFTYQYDVNGNMTGEATSRHFDWNHSDQMKAFRTQAGTSEASVHALYLYDAGGIRVKKLVRKQGGQIETSVYIDDIFEHHRFQTGENNYLHVMDGQQRVAMVRVGTAHPDDRGPAVQYHLGDHLGSSGVVVDGQGGFINREEFTPYGESSFGGYGRKRFRFTGKERDEESGLNYHEARYCLTWLGRWCSCDPKGRVDGNNLYNYTQNCPIFYTDPNGTERKPNPDPTVTGTKSNADGSTEVNINGASGADVYKGWRGHKDQNGKMKVDRDCLTAQQMSTNLLCTKNSNCETILAKEGVGNPGIWITQGSDYINESSKKILNGGIPIDKSQSVLGVSYIIQCINNGLPVQIGVNVAQQNSQGKYGPLNGAYVDHYLTFDGYKRNASGEVTHFFASDNAGGEFPDGSPPKEDSRRFEFEVRSNGSIVKLAKITLNPDGSISHGDIYEQMDVMVIKVYKKDLVRGGKEHNLFVNVLKEGIGTMTIIQIPITKWKNHSKKTSIIPYQ